MDTIINTLPFRLNTPDVYDVTCRSCVVTWDPPRDDAGSDICSYIIEVASGSSQWMEYGSVDAKTFFYELLALPENQIVSCRVKAVDIDGKHVVSDQRSFQLLGMDLLSCSVRPFLTVHHFRQIGCRITESFQWGLRSLNLVVEAVISSKLCSTFRELLLLTEFLSNHIEKFTQHLQHSREKILVLSKILSSSRKVLLSEKQSIECCLSLTKCESEYTKTELEQKAEELANLFAQLRHAEAAFVDSEKNTSRLRQELTSLKDISVGKAMLFLFLPVVAPLATSLSVTVMENKLKESERNLQSAWEYLQRNKERVETIQELIEQKEKSIQQNNEKIEKDEIHLQKIIQDLSYVQQTFENLEKCRSFLDLFNATTAGSEPDAIIFQIKHVYDFHPGFTTLQTLAVQLESTVPLCGFDDLKRFHTRIKMFEACEMYLKAALLEMGIDYNAEGIAAVRLPISNNLQERMKQTQSVLQEVIIHFNADSVIQEVPVLLGLLGRIFIWSIQQNTFFSNPKKINAVLRQIAESGLDAYQTGSDIMLRIHIQADKLSSEFNEALQNISQSSAMKLKISLTKRLNGIKSTVEKCISLSKNVDDKFIEIIKTIVDLKATISSSSEQKVGQFKSTDSGVEHSLKESFLQALVDEKQKHARKLTKLRTKIQEAEQTYQNYINPAGDEEVFGLAVAQGLVYGTDVLLLELCKPVQISLDTIKVIVADGTIQSHDRKMLSQGNGDIHRILTKTDSLLVNDAIYKTCSSEDDTEIVFDIQIGVKNVGISEQSVDNLAICEGIDLIHKHLQCIKHDSDPRDKMRGNRKIVTGIENVELLIKTGNVNNYKSFNLPHVKTEVSKDRDGRNKVQATVRKTRQSLQSVSSLCISELINENVCLTKEENLEHVSDILDKCLPVLVEFRQQWWNIVQFFESMKDIVDCSLHVSMENYSDVSTAVEMERARGGYSLSDFKRDMLTQEIANASILLQTIQQTSSRCEDYFTRFLSDHAKRLRTLFTMKKTHVYNEYKQFHTKCANAQEQIRQAMATEKHTA